MTVQLQISTLLWLTTTVAVILAVYRADPRGFWSLNRIFQMQAGWIQAALLFGMGSTAYVVGRRIAEMLWDAIVPHLTRIIVKLRPMK